MSKSDHLGPLSSRQPHRDVRERPGMGFATNHTVGAADPARTAHTAAQAPVAGRQVSVASSGWVGPMPGDRAMQRLERCIRRDLQTTGRSSGRGVESNPHWTMGGEHSGAGPAVAVAVLPRRAHRGPPWPWCDRFDPIPLPPGLMLRHARQPFDLRVRPRFDVSGMCSDTAMRPRRRDNRGHTTSEDAAQKRCSSSAGRGVQGLIRDRDALQPRIARRAGSVWLVKWGCGGPART